MLSMTSLFTIMKLANSAPFMWTILWLTTQACRLSMTPLPSQMTHPLIFWVDQWLISQGLGIWKASDLWRTCFWMTSISFLCKKDRVVHFVKQQSVTWNQGWLLVVLSSALLPVYVIIKMVGSLELDRSELHRQHCHLELWSMCDKLAFAPAVLSF